MSLSHRYFALKGLRFNVLLTLPLGSELCLIASKDGEGLYELLQKQSSTVTQLNICCNSFHEPIKIHLKCMFSDSTTPNHLSEQLGHPI